METYSSVLEAYDPELEKLWRDIDEYCESEEAQDLSAIVPSSSSNPCMRHSHSTDRERVKKMLDMFQALCKELRHEGKIRRIDYEAARVLRKRPDFVDIEKCIGSVPGVDVGDEFFYRVEVALAGLHKPPEAGIDYMRWGTSDLCISIVAIGYGDYSNYMRSAEQLRYCGQGGNVGRGRKEPEDQKMEKGNLALKNSIASRNPVRVIRGKRQTSKTVPVYIYDGLYTVETFWEEKAAHGKLTFKFELRRIPGQPKLRVDQWRKLGVVEGCY